MINTGFYNTCVSPSYARAILAWSLCSRVPLSLRRVTRLEGDKIREHSIEYERYKRQMKEYYETEVLPILEKAREKRGPAGKTRRMFRTPWSRLCRAG